MRFGKRTNYFYLYPEYQLEIKKIKKIKKTAMRTSIDILNEELLSRNEKDLLSRKLKKINEDFKCSTNISRFEGFADG